MGRKVEYGYRWIVDGQDEGWKTGYLYQGTDKNMRNPLGAFDPGKHTVVFRLLSGVKATKRLSFTVCDACT
ncbi:hypothetical protein ABZ897_40990 [Nonomuraea sp. NPDC046802]|uniref:hypothetical protein n=1 Tax=Nonomuraea sp. NPDC046802 TaxID=3154919 RepID=UPI0033CFF53E